MPAPGKHAWTMGNWRAPFKDPVCSVCGVSCRIERVPSGEEVHWYRRNGIAYTYSPPCDPAAMDPRLKERMKED